MLGLSSVAALLLVALTLRLPLWQMTLAAPQYPGGLRLLAYGDRLEGDLREINIINHYLGMKKIDRTPAPEMKMFRYSVFTLMVFCVLAPLHRRLGQLATAGILLVSIVILADLQWWLHDFGRNLEPTAPIRVKPFTPPVIGTSRIGNFQSTSVVSYGYLCLLGACLVLVVGRRIAEKLHSVSPREVLSGRTMIFTVGLLLPTGMFADGGIGAPVRQARGSSLQERIDLSFPGAVLVVEGGTHLGPITVQGPLTLQGRGDPVIDGQGAGSVVTVLGEGVVLEGFTIRNSGREVSEEPAGIKAEGSNHRFEKNRIEDVHFGIHLSRGGNNQVLGNRIAPGEEHGARPGHGISLWYQRNTRLAENRITHARDGIYLSFSDDLRVEGNEVRDSRYGLHSMYARKAYVRNNRIRANLLGAALMYSEELTLECNRIENHREGATAYGVLLKDIDELLLECNTIVGNRVGIYADNTPQGRGRRALIRGNLLAGNDAALALQSNVALIFTGNSIVNNLTTVRAEGAHLSRDNQWSAGGLGNYWDEYRGYDLDSDGIGDIPYRYEVVMNEIVRRTPLARAFLYTPAHLALESGAKLFPIVRTDPLIVDSHPLMRDLGQACREERR